MTRHARDRGELDAGEIIIPPFEPYILLSSATLPGSPVPTIKYVVLPDEKGSNPGGHFFADNGKQLSETIVDWLEAQL